MAFVKDRASSSKQLPWKVLCRSLHLVWGPTRRRAIKKDSKVVNRHWVNRQARSLSHNIQVLSSTLWPL